MTDQNQIVQVIEQSDLPKPKVQALMEVFAPAFQEARGLVETAKNITVTDEGDIETMQLAREHRLRLKEIRITVEKTRKELKEQSLREGRAIDGAANILKALIVPVEERLLLQEKFAELLEEKRLTERYQKRLNLLTPYVSDVTLYKLKEMSDAAFDTLLADCKAAHAARIAAEEKAAAEQKENERLQKLFTERRIELAPYQDFIDPKMWELKITTPQDVFDRVLADAKLAKQKHVAEQAAIAEQAAKDRKAKEEAEAKLKQQQEAQAEQEREAKAKADAEAAAKEKADRDALLAPDAIKLYQLAADIEVVKLPAVKSNEAQKLVNATEKKLAELAMWLHAETKKL